MERKAYLSDISDEEWGFVAPYLTLMTEEAPQRDYSLREVFHGLQWLVRQEPPVLAFAIMMAKPVVETMLIVHNTLHCYNYLVPNLEFQDSSHAFYPFRRRRYHHRHGGGILAQAGRFPGQSGPP